MRFGMKKFLDTSNQIIHCRNQHDEENRGNRQHGQWNVIVAAGNYE